MVNQCIQKNSGKTCYDDSVWGKELRAGSGDRGQESTAKGPRDREWSNDQGGKKRKAQSPHPNHRRRENELNVPPGKKKKVPI